MLQQRYDRTIEEKWQKIWEEQKTYAFEEENTTKPIYSIDTPPPFTSGDLHMGHVLSYSYFDFAARYKRMRGFNVYYPQGWDTQGFPTEVKVEKKYGRLRPVQFREKCVEFTNEMITCMKKQMVEMGFSPDWRYEYRTMDPDYHRKVQISLIRMYQDKLIYRAKYPVFWCPRCESAVAKAELDDEERTGTLNYIKFEAENGEQLQIATTRPELMPACVAVLFHPDDERYKHLDGKKIQTALGKEIIAIADKDVEKEFGTGLLMVCTFGDKMDVVWVHRYKLPIIEVIDQRGRIQNITGTNETNINGLKIEEARKKIIEIFDNKNKIIKKEQIKQNVKVHDRCKTPIELITSYQWFADIKTTAKKIKELSQKIKWIPEFGINYLIDWVENAEWDWVISRQRIFGTPLPFYYCETCGETAAAEEKELPMCVEKTKRKKCKCGSEMKTETSTCDCWVDSSITPLIIAGWPNDSKKMQRLYPASLRPQGVEIVRTWAFYTIYRSGVALTKTPPFESILLNGNVLAPDGKKMSKSLGNIISPSDLLREYPTDAIRQWAAMSGAMARDRPFSYEDIKYAKGFLNKIWNAARFYLSYKREITRKPELTIVDKWLLGKLNALIHECTEHMEKFEYHYAITKIQQFFWHDLCDNYIEYIKHRLHNKLETSDAAVYTLERVLRETMKLLAPITPHITEEIHTRLFDQKGSVSIHKTQWPTTNPEEEYQKEIAAMEEFNKIVKQIRQHKAKNKLLHETELETVRISVEQPLEDYLLAELKTICKIKNLELLKGEFSVSIS